MKYISKRKGDTTYLIPTGDPPEDKIVKSDLPRYKRMKLELTQKMQWTKKKVNDDALRNLSQ